MNDDHQDSLIRYLEHFCHLSSASARHARLIDISFDHLTLQANGGSSYEIPVKPPLTAWADARPRVVAMDAEAVAGLGRSDITVKRYASPKGIAAVVPVFILILLLVFLKRSNFQPGSFLYDLVLVYAPGSAQFGFKIQPLIFYLTTVMHSGECLWLVRGRLRKHTVPTFSKLWWTWVLNAFLEGRGTFPRFDAIVEEERLKRENAKH